MHSAGELREGAMWFAAAARNASDRRLKAPMLARARELSRMAKALAKPENSGSPPFDQDQCR